MSAGLTRLNFHPLLKLLVRVPSSSVPWMSGVTVAWPGVAASAAVTPSAAGRVPATTAQTVAAAAAAAVPTRILESRVLLTYSLAFLGGWAGLQGRAAPTRWEFDEFQHSGQAYPTRDNRARRTIPLGV